MGESVKPLGDVGLINAFTWSSTIEGGSYWQSVYDRTRDGKTKIKESDEGSVDHPRLFSSHTKGLTHIDAALKAMAGKPEWSDVMKRLRRIRLKAPGTTSSAPAKNKKLLLEVSMK